MSIIKTIDEVRDFYPANVSLNIGNIKPYFDDAAQKYLVDFLSQDQYDSLLAWYINNKNDSVTGYDDLLPYVQRVIVRFAIFLGTDQLDVVMQNQGFAVVSNSNLTPASPDRVRKFRESMESSGWDAIEMMLRYLETNKANFDLWTDSDAYTLATKNFVNSATEFDKTVNIGQSRLRFHKMRQTIDQVEYTKIYPAISKVMADDIIAQIKADDIDDEYETILPSLKKAVIFFTAAIEIPEKKEQYEQMALHYINDVKKIIDATPDDYPLYRDSGIYTSDSSSFPNYENAVDNTIYVFGPKG